MQFVRLNALVMRFMGVLFSNSKAANLILFVLFVLSAFASSRLTLKSDFSDLLPEHLPSVKAVRDVSERLGGAGVLMIGVESPNFETNKKFVEALVDTLRPSIGQLIRSIDYRYADIEAYERKYGPHYLSTADLKKLIRGAAVSEPTAFSEFKKMKDYYLSAEEGRLLVVLLQPVGQGLGIESGDEMINLVKRKIAELRPFQFGPEIKIHFAGSIHSTVEEMSIIKKDMFGTAILLVTLLLLCLFLFFWSGRAIVLLIAHLVYPVAWTFGLTQIVIGYLNTQTAFLGSLIVGTGINYGIILLSRYREFRNEGREVRDAILKAVESTWMATLIASSTTAVGFLSLFATHNQGLAQFGFVGFVGVLFCWLAAFLILPLWLFQWESRYPLPVRSHPLALFFQSFVMKLANGLIPRYRWGLVGLVAISAVSLAGIWRLSKDPLEYNIHNLRTESAAVTGTEAVEKRLNQVFGDAETPSIVVFQSIEDARNFCSVVRKREMSENCMTAFDLLPPPYATTPERKQILAMVGASENPPSLGDLPASLRQRFSDREGTLGLVGYITPDRAKPLHVGKNLLDYTDAHSELLLPSGNRVTAAGDWFILADLLRSLKNEGPIVAILAFVLISLLGAYLVGSFSFGLLMSFCLALATLWMLGAQGFSGIKYNFFNFIALPLTFGMGIDYPINVFVRCRQEGFINYGRVVVTSGVAVLICSLTTIIGYYTLVDASNLALRSFAQLAIFGELACLLMALVGLPILLRRMGYFIADQEVKERKAS